MASAGRRSARRSAGSSRSARWRSGAGSGRIVASARFEHTIGGFYSFSREIERGGRAPGTRVLGLDRRAGRRRGRRRARDRARDPGGRPAPDPARRRGADRRRDEPVAGSPLPGSRDGRLLDRPPVRHADERLRLPAEPRSRDVRADPAERRREPSCSTSGAASPPCGSSGSRSTRTAGRSSIAGARSVGTVTVTPWSCATDDRPPDQWFLAPARPSTGCRPGARPRPRAPRSRPHWRSPGPPSARWPTLFADADRVIVTGAGSSYYLAQVTAAVGREMTGRIDRRDTPVGADPPRRPGVLGTGLAGRQPVIVISRSGSTSEAVEVAERVAAAGHLTIAVTCRANSPLAARAHRVLVSPAGDEQAIVMTRSFASMLALLLRLVAGVATDRSLADDLDRLPERWPEAVAGRRCRASTRLGRSSAGRRPRRRTGARHRRGVVPQADRDQPGPGPTPTSRSSSVTDRSRSASPGVLVVGLIGGPGATEEARVLREAGGLGADTWLDRPGGIDDRAVAPAGSRSSGSDLHPWARLPLLLYPGQALALTLALVRGRDPDAPRHLGQVVVLDPDDDPAGRLPAAAPSCAAADPRGPVDRGSGGRRCAQPPRVGVRRRVGRSVGGRAPAAPRRGRCRDARRPRRRVRRARCRARSTAGRPRRPDRLVVFAGLDYEGWQRDPAFGETEALRLRDSAARGRARTQGLEAARAPGARSGRPPRRGRRRAARSALGDRRRARAAGRHPHRRPDRVLRAARSQRTSATRSCSEHPDWHFWPTRPPDDPDAPGLPAVRRAARGVSTGSSVDIRRRPSSAPTSAAPPRTSGCVSAMLGAHPNLLRRHRGPARRARPPAVHAPGRSSCAIADRILFGTDVAPRPGQLSAPLPVPRDVRRVVRRPTDEVPGQGRWQIHGLGLPD